MRNKDQFLASRRSLLTGGALLGAALVVGCTPRPQSAEIPPIRFRTQPPFLLRVSVVDVLDETAFCESSTGFQRGCDHHPRDRRFGTGRRTGWSRPNHRLMSHAFALRNRN